MAQRLTRDDWVEAALDALVSSGPAAVAIEPLAAKLGTTKGSGYWHFSSRGELLESALAEYQRRYTAAVIDTVEAAGGTPSERLARLLDLVLATPDPATETRMLSSTDELVLAAVEKVTRARINYVTRLYREAGWPPAEARRRGQAGYLVFLGYAVLSGSVPALLPRSAAGRRRLRDLVLSEFAPIQHPPSRSRITP